MGVPLRARAKPMIHRMVPDRPYIRSERQCLVRLPKTGAVVFSIHTRVIHESSLTNEQAHALRDNPIPEEFR